MESIEKLPLIHSERVVLIPKKSIKFLNLKQQIKVNKNVEKHNTGKKLYTSVKENLEFLSKIKTYRGLRHKFKYPSRGQRTHTNAKTKQKFKF